MEPDFLKELRAYERELAGRYDDTKKRSRRVLLLGAVNYVN